jgi:hypothetical protein
MASLTPKQGLADQLLSGDRARVLLVNKELRDLS